MTHEENLLGAMVPSSDSDHSITSLAYQLHNSVPADRWCVTFLDLDFLREEVQAAVAHNSDSATSKRHGWLWTFRQRLWSKHIHGERAIYKASYNESRQNELGLDEESEWFGMWYVYKPCLARGRFWVPLQSKALLACRCADCLVLHAGEPSKLEHFVFFALTQFFTICCCIESIGRHVGGTQPAPIRVYTRLWCAYEAYLAQKEGKTILDCKILKLAWHSERSAVDGGSCKSRRFFGHHCNSWLRLDDPLDCRQFCFWSVVWVL